MSLVQPLPPGPLDIVGDIHGESEALDQLLGHLGYDALGRHPQGRRLVFVGDFCDRGPDSPGVLARVVPMLESGHALAVLGNHEINLLREDAKDGSGWFFDSRVASDTPKYAPFARMPLCDIPDTLALLERLPIAMEREDLRVVHAAWRPQQIAMARELPLGSARSAYDHYEALAAQQAQVNKVAERMRAERQQWPHDLEDRNWLPPFLPAHSESELAKAMVNPLKVLTSGVERECRNPFYAGGKWRFVERVAWWNEYEDAQAVVVGHYWRRLNRGGPSFHGAQAENLFGQTGPLSWHGRRGNVFCVDYSVGGRWNARLAGEDPQQRFKLAAMRWPERRLVFDDGAQADSEEFGVTAAAAA
ncbi:calcineurin-like phosphoesterase family protein [Delftia acidovorans]|uniref:metallophosphoesterase n=1 Tax=Delftia acidovorans TaxID=80866 RepID=UPI000504B4D9|nr:metallophosphoesterase [Delftia acidovorans]KFJ12042.1 calcineurin-like phosphoesterase family protein [Delftia acidovorans]MCA1068942.1 Bis(5'-nucleosyl)-tetraphosphatase PrpE [asymmetrical] [Delftia acidovorans]MCG3782470.1 metallophosphoesterase [Delftia acidovorans]QQB48695.1 metallophosphoesterase [Delftia acidovorans]